MNKFITTDIYFFSALFLIFVSVVLYFKGLKKIENKFFFMTSIFVIVILILEAIGWIIDGEPNLKRESMIINSLLMAFNPIPSITMISFFNYKICMNANSLKKSLKYYMIPFIITILLVILNIRNGWIFTIDANNIYSRNFGIYLIPILSIILYPIEFIRLRKHLIGINGRILLLMLVLFFSPIVGSIFQLLFYGVGLIWPLMSFSIIVTFFIYEYHDTKKDRLTNLENREVVEKRVCEMIKRNIPFSLIMIDIDKFKMINDKYGHLEGDRVLVSFSKALSKSISKEDTISRYGGDEFLIIVESKSKTAGHELVEKIKVSIDKLNSSNILASKIEFSAGCLYCDDFNIQTSKDLINQVDKYMYLQKEKSRV